MQIRIFVGLCQGGLNTRIEEGPPLAQAKNVLNNSKMGLANGTILQGESKKLTHSKCLYFGYFITFLLISFNSILFPYTREEKWVVNFLWRCQGGWNIWFFVLGVDFWISLHSRWQLLWKLRCLCMTFKFTSFLDCFNLFLSYWNLYQIQNVCKQYGI